MSKKLIITGIDTCDKCPHNHWQEVEQSDICTADKSKRKTLRKWWQEGSAEIPDWCPLPDEP